MHKTGKEWEKDFAQLIWSLNMDQEKENGTNPYISRKKEEEIKSFIQENFHPKSESILREEVRELIDNLETREPVYGVWVCPGGCDGKANQCSKCIGRKQIILKEDLTDFLLSQEDKG